jgi:hypothetical protein
MIGAVVIKAEYISEAKEKYGNEMVDKIFTLMKGQHPDTILWELENEEKECFLLLMKNRYQKDETKN